MTQLDQALLRFAQTHKVVANTPAQLVYTEQDFRVIRPHVLGGERLRAHYGRLGTK